MNTIDKKLDQEKQKPDRDCHAYDRKQNRTLIAQTPILSHDCSHQQNCSIKAPEKV